MGSAITSLCELLLTSDGVAETEIERVIDKSMILKWDEWKGIKQLLLDFFLNSELYQGRLQGLWKGDYELLSLRIVLYHDHE